MPSIPQDFTATKLDHSEVTKHAELARRLGWAFYEHPTKGNEHPLLAVRKGDRIVYNTNDFDVPDYL